MILGRQRSVQCESPVVGIPRALVFYKHAAQCVTFFEALGARVQISSGTCREILDKGIEFSIDESCLPVKIYLGHVEQLVSKRMDYILIFRQQDFDKHEVTCAKLWGLPDICRNTFKLPPGTNWLELNISPVVDRLTPWRAWQKAGSTLCRSQRRIKAAYELSLQAQQRYEDRLRAGHPPDEALRLARSAGGQSSSEAGVAIASQESLAIALLGHPYIVFDEYFGKPLTKLLRSLGASVRYVEGLDHEQCRVVGREVSPALYWTYSREILGAAELYLRAGVDGVIFVEAFPCGPDALAMDYAVRTLRGRAPLMRLVLDELQSFSGLQTRLESFVDVIQLQREEAAHAY